MDVTDKQNSSQIAGIYCANRSNALINNWPFTEGSFGIMDAKKRKIKGHIITVHISIVCMYP